MSGTLRDDLASLKIDRRDGDRKGRDRDRDRDRGFETPTAPRRSGGGSGGGGFGLLAALIWLIPLGLIGGGGYYAYRQYDGFRPRTEVNTGLVQAMTSGEAEKLLSAKGYLKSRYQAMIGAKIPGRVEKMYVEEGSRVKKGQVLAVLEHKELNAMLAQRQARLKQTEAELAEARADLRQKGREADRARRLSSAKTISIEEAQKADSLREMAEARMAALDAALTLGAANVRESEETIATMSLYAPFDGTVVEKQGEEGEVITPSAMSSSISRSAVVTLASLNLMEVETDVAENLLSRVAVGQPAEVSVSAVPNKHYRGRLRQIIPMGDRTRGTVKVKVEILDPDAALFPELVATVHFLPDKGLNNPNAGRSFVFVPKSAILEENGHQYAWVVDGKSRVGRRQVEVALTADELARVEGGLKAGDVVVTTPGKNLRENEVVKVAE